MLKQQLQQKLQQKLAPSQIQTIKFVEITTLELEERVRQELEENPALDEDFDNVTDTPTIDDFAKSESDEQEVADDDDQDNYEDYNQNDDANYEFDTDDYDYSDYDRMDDDTPAYRLKTNNLERNVEQKEIPLSEGTTFKEYLEEQAGFLQLTENEKNIVRYIIGNIDDEGYLRRAPDMMVDDLLFQAGVECSEKEIEQLIKLVQSLEPSGVAAKNLRECLLLQLARKPQTSVVKFAQKIVKSYFEGFSKKHYDRIQRSLNIDDKMMKNVIKEIVKLNPKPGNAWSGDVLEHTKSTIIPDFTLENDNGKLIVHLNQSNIPELRINANFKNMLSDFNSNKKNQTREMKDAILFAKQKVDSAQWFIDAVKQRQQTLLITMTAIVQFQHDFFIEGHESFLKPMILKDIADITGYDISTISRVSNSKYIQTEYAIYPVKYFFSESILNEDGKEISTREIKTFLQERVDNEDKRHPLNDDDIATYLKECGYIIARRTVAKYREQLNIPVARLRVQY
ncbi:MAG: RNA polymerase factor sigma-54 [Prevotellaceae bacterium]|jgi:RNA polymerase sigma-54 factor|nr:RNA polymerase factor sigma-54 [Prevotellaceae bacterium]